MSRYIDVEELGIGKADRNAFTIPEYADGWNSVIEIIENTPTADVVEVVRCWNCVWYEWYEGTEKCLGHCKLHRFGVTGDFYCAIGRRADDGN